MVARPSIPSLPTQDGISADVTGGNNTFDNILSNLYMYLDESDCRS
jgi:hypothetical protein